MKVICFGVIEVERPVFEKFNKYNYDLTLTSESLTSNTVNLLDGHDAIIVRESDKVDRAVLDYAHKLGIKYLLTRTAGFDHIDIEYANQLGIKMARIPSYSPTAIAELAVSMAFSLSRKTNYFAYKAFHYDFMIDPAGYSKEMKSSVVGIIGTGRIGFETAKMFKGLGAKVVGYDIYKNEAVTSVLEYVELDELLKESDIVAVSVPYFKGQNDNLINKDFISKMKDNAIIINCSRGQLQDEQAILDALKSNKLLGAGLDVFKDEKNCINKKLTNVSDPILKELISLYPRVLVTPHIGFYTTDGVGNMVEFALDNLNEYLTTGECKNKI